ncbi:tetratricopeptide repeat protein [Flavobacteriaceae bacterium MAR_2010_72]|nr:tetratricopeptide repeat protein [Flavobacteriaceae bacterium MAR_2010_72]
MITQQLKVTILGKGITTKVTNTEAYNLYLQAKQLQTPRSYNNLTNSEKLIRQSIAIDSTYAPSWALLSDIIYRITFNYMKLPLEKGIPLGKQAAVKAIDLDRQYAFAYAALSDFNVAEWDFESSERNFKQALQFAPENAEIIRRAAGKFMDLGKKAEAIALLKKAIDLDPLNYLSYFNLSLFYLWNKQIDEAEESLKKFLLMFPDAGFAHNTMGQILLTKGDYKNALLEIEKDDDPFWNLNRKAMVVYAMGNKIDADALLKKHIDNYGSNSWPNIAHVYAFRGEKDEAFKWLELAYDHKDASLLEILNYPEMESLWGDPRWNKFINKLGLPKDHGFHLD